MSLRVSIRAIRVERLHHALNRALAQLFGVQLILVYVALGQLLPSLRENIKLSRQLTIRIRGSRNIRGKRIRFRRCNNGYDFLGNKITASTQYRQYKQQNSQCHRYGNSFLYTHNSPPSIQEIIQKYGGYCSSLQGK